MTATYRLPIVRFALTGGGNEGEEVTKSQQHNGAKERKRSALRQ